MRVWRVSSGARIEADIEIQNREPVFAIRGEVVSELHSAARAERKAVDMRGLIAGRQRIPCAGFLGHGLTNGQSCGQPRRADILIKERRRDAQGRGDIVEAVHFVLRGQQIFGVDLYAQQILHGNSVFRPSHALDSHVAGNRTIGDVVERVLERTDERVDFGLVGLTAARRRHQVAAQFSHRFLPDLSVVSD